MKSREGFQKLFLREEDQNHISLNFS